jgi:hypothetical protein
LATFWLNCPILEIYIGPPGPLIPGVVDEPEMVQHHRPYRRRDILNQRIELRLQSTFGIDQHP